MLYCNTYPNSQKTGSKWSNLVRRFVASLLIYSQLLPIAAAAVLPNATKATSIATPRPFYANQDAQNTALKSLSLTSQQLGLTGPLNAGVTYSDLTGTFFNAQYVLPLGKSFAVGALGEYGTKQYRFSGTLGYGFSERSQMKFTAERLGQRLPFQFASGDLDARVHQDAYGVRFQQLFDLPFFQGFNAGAYYANAANKSLDPVVFMSNGRNCGGYEGGLLCVNYRHIAGAASTGLDVGAEFLLSPSTLVGGNVYYDQVRYSTQFNPFSDHDRDGIGAGIKLNQLLGSRLKLMGEATAREIYDTYQGGLSWLPGISRLGMELSVIGQHIVSHNATPNNSSVNVQLGFLLDGNKSYDERFKRNSQHLNSIGQWVQAPAVRMNQVLAVAEQITALLAPSIRGINPNFGPFAGGNLVTISGSNFAQGLFVYFGGQLATSVQVLSPTTIQVVVPPLALVTLLPLKNEVVDVVLANPDGQQTTFASGYRYTTSPSSAPVLTTITPAVGGTAGGTAVTLVGRNFQGATSVTIGGVALSNVVVNAGGTQITGLTGAHIAASNLAVIVTTALGNSSGGPTYTYQLNASVVTTPTDGAVINDATPGFVGTGEPGANITVSTGATTLCSTTVAADGNWSCISSALVNGAYPVTVVQTDTFGTVSPATSINVTIAATTIPPAPGISSPSNGATIDSATPDFTGTGEPGAIVTVSSGAQTLCTATVAADGTWSCTSTALANGPYSVSIVQTDTHGSVSPAATVNITVAATTVLPAPVISNPADGSYLNAVTITQPLAVQGLGEVGAVVFLSLNNITYSAVVQGDGSWSISIPSSDLAGLNNGSYPLEAKQESSGQTSALASITINVLTLVPAPTIDPVTPDNIINSDEAQLGQTLSGTTGSTASGQTVIVNLNGTEYSATVDESTGVWSLPLPSTLLLALPQGSIPLVVTATDVAGNSGTTSGSFTMATILPNPTINTPFGDGYLNIAEAGVEQIISGTTSSADQTVVVNIQGTTYSATVLADGTWSYTLTPAQMATFQQGPTDINVTATDAVGNVGYAVASFTVATIAPTITITSPASGDTVSRLTTLTVSGVTSVTTGQMVTLNVNGSSYSAVVASDSSWSIIIPPTALSPGALTLDVAVTDIAGNPASNSITITVT